MAKKSKICLAALLLLVLAASLSLAACDPGSFTEMANAQQEFFEEYGGYYTALGAGGLVRYRDKDTGATGYLDQSSGEVVPCCLDAYGQASLGNIWETPLQDILTSKQAEDMRRGFQEGRLVHALCQRCQYRTRFDGKRRRMR